MNYLYADKPVVQFISVFFVLQRPGDPRLSDLPEESSGGRGVCGFSSVALSDLLPCGTTVWAERATWSAVLPAPLAETGL